MRIDGALNPLIALAGAQATLTPQGFSLQQADAPARIDTAAIPAGLDPYRSAESDPRFEAQLAAQQTRDAARAAFREEIEKTPMERLREEIMESLGLDEDDLNAMAPEERRAIEEQIARLIAERLTQTAQASSGQQNEKRSPIDVLA